MPLVETIYIWSRISAVLVLGIMGMKGFNNPDVEINEVPLKVGFGWERTLWKGDDPVKPGMPGPIQIQMNKCDQISERSPEVTTKFFCKIQKVKLQILRHVVHLMKKAYSIANSILPTFGGGGYVMIIELLAFSGLVTYIVKTQNCCLGMVMEKVWALCNSTKTSCGRVKLDSKEETGRGHKNDVEELKSVDLGISLEGDEFGTPGGEDLTFSSGSSSGRRFHGELAFQEGMNEEQGTVGEVNSCEVDGKMKKEVRFSDDSFDDNGISEAYGCKSTATKVSQRRASPVKRMLPEPVAKNCSVKMTRSVPSAATGAGPRSSWHP